MDIAEQLDRIEPAGCGGACGANDPVAHPGQPGKSRSAGTSSAVAAPAEPSRDAHAGSL